MLLSNQRLRELVWRRGVFGAIQTARALSWRVPGLAAQTFPPELKTVRTAAGMLPPTAAKGGPSVLFFSPRGQYTILYEALVAAGVRARGASVNFVTCGGDLPVCSYAPHEVSPPPPCTFCRDYGATVLDSMGFHWTELRNLRAPTEGVASSTIASLADSELLEFEYRDVPIGRLVRPAVAGYLRGDRLTTDARTTTAYRRFLEAAIPMVEACTAALDRFQPDRVFMTSGLFFPESIMLHLCQRRQIPTLTYEFAHRSNALVFGWDRPAGYYESEGAWERRSQVLLTPDQESRIRGYLADRALGSGSAGDTALYWRKMASDTEKIRAQLGLDRDRPILTLFTNISWDTSLYERDTVFTGYRQWVTDTVDAFTDWPEAQLIIRVHPGEVRLPLQVTRDTFMSDLNRARPDLPPNVFVVPSDSRISSYGLGAMSSAILVYASTMGLELAVMGKPVVVAGQVHYTGKGFTVDVPNREAYPALLREAISKPAQQTAMDIALRYAYFFFFQVAVDFPLIDVRVPGKTHLDPAFLQSVQSDHDGVLSRICESLLKQRDILNEEVA